MSAILNYLNAHNLPIFQLILMIFVSKFMVHRALSDKTYLSLGLLSPLRSMSCWFDLHWRHCLVSLSKTLYPLFSTSSTQEDLGVQWLSGRVLDSRQRGCGFEPHRITALCP